MLSNNLLSKLIVSLREAQDKQAHDSLRFPKSDPFEHGRQVGTYQGISQALDILEGVVEADALAERNS